MKSKESQEAGLDSALLELDRAVQRIAQHLPRPRLLGSSGREGWRYEAPNSYVMQILKLVRVTSGLYAGLHLVSVRHLQEACVVLRSVDEAIRDVNVLDEAHHNPDPTEYQQRMVDEFFEDDAERFNAVVAGGPSKVSRVPKKKKLAASERRLRPAAGGEPVRQMMEGISLVLDGYTHCAYAQTMELYDGTRYHLSGVDDSTRAADLRSFITLLCASALRCVSTAMLAVDTDEAGRLLGVALALDGESEKVPS